MLLVMLTSLCWTRATRAGADNQREGGRATERHSSTCLRYDDIIDQSFGILSGSALSLTPTTTPPRLTDLVPPSFDRFRDFQSRGTEDNPGFRRP